MVSGCWPLQVADVSVFYVRWLVHAFRASHKRKSMNSKQQPETKGLDSSKGSRIETADSRFIRLLTFISQAGGTVSTNETDSGEDVLAYAELVSGVFISGKISKDRRGQICAVTNMDMLPSGRAHLADLKHKGEMNTSLGFIKTH